MPLDLVGVSKRYQHAEGTVDALKDVTLTIPEGEFVTITGRSGAGKSTLLLALGGLIRPSAGEMRFRETELHRLTDAQLARFRRDHLGFVMQNFSLIPYLTAAQNVMIPLALKKVSLDEQKRRAAELLEAVGLGDRGTHLPRELSVGQQQRVAIARAFANDPALILADEPTGNLDPTLSEDILALLEQLNREKGTTVIMVTHSPEAAKRGTFRVHLEYGRLTQAERETTPAPP